MSVQDPARDKGAAMTRSTDIRFREERVPELVIHEQNGALPAGLIGREPVGNSDHLIAQGRIAGVRHLIAHAQEREHRVIG